MNPKERAIRFIASYTVLCMTLLAVASCRTPAGRTSGRVVDDAAITSKVKAKLFEEDILKGLAISVETFEGNVTLTGAVDTPEQKERAGKIAKSVFTEYGP